jgi:hypothetical protein
MLPAKFASAWADVAQSTIRMLAVMPAALVKREGGARISLEVALRTVAPTDIDLVNAWGIGARIITIAADDVTPDQAPEQYDRIEAAGGQFTVDYVHPIQLGETLVAYKCFSRGQSL